jgi:murein L,D-transpeptidase YcbB/YkuD
MHRRFLPAACAGFAAALALADLAQAQSQATVTADQPAAQGTPATPPAPQQEAAPPPVPPIDPLVVKVRELAAQPRQRVIAAERAAMAAFYSDRTELVWVTAEGFTPRAEHAMAEIAKADDWGLEARAFELPQLGDRSVAALAEAEIKLSLAVLRYTRFAHGGRAEPSEVSRHIDQKLTIPEPKSVLEAVSATDTPGAYLTDQHPKHVQFQRLRQALLKARAGTSQPEEKAEQIVRLPDGPALKVGMEHPHVALLRQRLKVRTSPGTEPMFDGDVADAVKAFQKKSGLRADGVVSRQTRVALNGAGAGAPKPAFGSEVQRIILNMERWRWMPDDLGDFHVWNNIPEYQTRVLRKGQVIHQAKIIVGKPVTPTVQFTANMRYVIFGPDWGVPDSIKIKEILPYLRTEGGGGGFFGFGGGTDTRVLEKHNLKVSYNGRPVDASQIDWSQVDIRKFNFIQPPGPGNVLGEVKFRFPNKHDIYMHDTPQRELFNHAVRTFSHGCMRTQNPGRLAEVLLEEDKGWSAAHVKNLMAQGNNNSITLTKTIPVHTTYFTMVVGDDGRVQSFSDVYGQDNRLNQALNGRALPLEPPSIDSDTANNLASREGRPAKRYKQQSQNDLFSGLFGN